MTFAVWREGDHERILRDMKHKIAQLLFVGAISVGVISACSSSGTSQSPCDAACQSSIGDENQSYLASLSAAVESPATADSESAREQLPAGTAIVDNYDSATCADWAATDPTDQTVVALYYANKYDDPKPDEDADSIVKIITTSCDAYGAKETPEHIAKVSIATVYGGS